MSDFSGGFLAPSPLMRRQRQQYDSGIALALVLQEKRDGGFMKYLGMFLLMAAVSFTACDREQKSGDQSSRSTAPDNTARNERDRSGDTKTPGDQAENEADRTITQNVRQAITSDSALSTNAQNVKIISQDGNVTLRGPVKSEQEKKEIEAKAKQAAGVKRVDNQLEVTG
jgi:hyperosmotically inducible protein